MLGSVSRNSEDSTSREDECIMTFDNDIELEKVGSCNVSPNRSPRSSFSIDSILSHGMMQQEENNPMRSNYFTSYEKLSRQNPDKQTLDQRSTVLRRKVKSQTVDLNNNNNNDNDYDYVPRKLLQSNRELQTHVPILKRYQGDERCHCQACFPTTARRSFIFTDDVRHVTSDGHGYSRRSVFDASHFFQDQLNKGLTSQYHTTEEDQCNKRRRTIFTTSQLERLEYEFQQQQYIVGQERRYLARELGLNEIQVKVWFQNRRIKWRKYMHGHLNNESLMSKSDNLQQKVIYEKHGQGIETCEV